jgi:hypothetical protein
MADNGEITTVVSMSFGYTVNHWFNVFSTYIAIIFTGHPNESFPQMVTVTETQSCHMTKKE